MSYYRGVLVSVDEGKAKLNRSDNGEEVVIDEAKLFCANLVSETSESDISNLGSINDGNILEVIEHRYENGLVHTNCADSCIVLNPNQMFPIYSPYVTKAYASENMDKLPPHIFRVARSSFDSLRTTGMNQMIVLTGESGSGKTVCNNRLLQYFCNTTSPIKSLETVTIDDKLIAAAPLFSAFGNAKTSKNDNSSRFGKLTRLHFNQSCQLGSADIETFVLEKSRIFHQLPGERSFHIFYQLLACGDKELLKRLFLTSHASDYIGINQGDVKIKGTDDKEDFLQTNELLSMAEFDGDEKMNIWRIIASILHAGNFEFTSTKSGAASVVDREPFEAFSYLLGVKNDDMVRLMEKPKILVGNEWVAKENTAGQAKAVADSLATTTYEKLFKVIVSNLNDILWTNCQRRNFVGILDISGFENLAQNSFEQMTINLINEKIQQALQDIKFNMEQELYQAEGLDWQKIDFDFDRLEAIDLIQRPDGIFSLLEECCMYEKPSQAGFVDKLFAQHLGKSDAFSRQVSRVSHEAHFEIKHYAGQVAYNVDGWIEKNRNHTNQCLIDLLAESKNELVKSIWQNEASGKSSGASKTKKTLSEQYSSSITRLMSIIRQTEAHFIRCIIPNSNKKTGEIDNKLVASQLRNCGIQQACRLAKQGFPTQIPFDQFCERYDLIHAEVRAEHPPGKKAACLILKAANLDHSSYKIGKSMVFLKANQIQVLEDARNKIIEKNIMKLQQQAKIFLAKKDFAKREEVRDAVSIIQSNWRAYKRTVTWQWRKILIDLKPLLSSEQNLYTEEEKETLEELQKTASALQLNLQEEKFARKQIDDLYAKLCAEKQELEISFQTDSAIISNLEEKCNLILESKVELDTQLKLLNEQLEDEKEINSDLSVKKSRALGDCVNLKNEISDLELTIAKVEKEKHVMEIRIQNLKEEMVNYEATVQRITSEKKNLQELQDSTLDDLQAESDKNTTINRLKTKLEAQIDDLDAQLEAEKKIRLDMERSKRQVELNHRMASETIIDLENDKAHLEEALSKSENLHFAANAKYETECQTVATLQKKIKDLQSRVEEVEDLIEQERNTKGKIERQRDDLRRELEELNERLEEAGGATNAQIELNKRREAEMTRLRRDLADANLAHDLQVQTLRKKASETACELSDRIDQGLRLKSKLEKEKQEQKAELEDLRQSLASVTQAKIGFEKLCRNQEDQLHEASEKNAELSREMADMNAANARLTAINDGNLKTLEEKQQLVHQLTRTKNAQLQEIDSLKKSTDEEARAKTSLANALQQTQRELEALRDHHEEELIVKAELQRTLSRANNEVAQWRTKYETDAIQRTEELEDAKKKLAGKLQDAEVEIEQNLSKLLTSEKQNARLGCEIDDITVTLQNVADENRKLSRKTKNFEREISEYGQKLNQSETERETILKESRALSTELFKVKNAYEESLDALETIKRENSTLQEEISDLTDRLDETDRAKDTLDREKRETDLENNEVKAALEDAEAAVATEEAKVARLQVEVCQTKTDFEKRLCEKDDEMENMRKNAQRAVESIQTTLDGEMKSRAEVLRQKKKLEGDIQALEEKLSEANNECKEGKILSKQLREKMSATNEELKGAMKTNEDLKDQLSNSENRSRLFEAEMEEFKAALDLSEKNRKCGEAEIQNLAERSNLLHMQNSGLVQSKRKAEQELINLQADYDEVNELMTQAEVKAKEAVNDAALMAEELKKEQDQSCHLERFKKNQEVTIRDLRSRLDEAENAAMKGGRQQIQKLDQRIRDLENALDLEHGKTGESMKNQKKLERKLKEVVLQSETDKKHLVKLQELVDKLQIKVKQYKKQALIAEEAANENLQKFRKAKHELDDSEERANQAEKTLNQLRPTQ